MKIAVVIPAYNEEKNILNALKSLINQTIKPNAIVVVNDGSTDNTALVVRDFKKNHEDFNVHLLNLKRSTGYGVGYSRNLFMGKEWLDGNSIQYDYLMVLDADQRLAPNYIKLCVDAFDDNVAIVGGRTHGTKFNPIQPRGAHRLLSKEFLGKFPFPLTYATDSYHFYAALQNGYFVKVIKDAIAYEVRKRHASSIDNFWRGRECYRIGYSVQYLLGRVVNNIVVFKSMKPLLMLYGFLFSLLGKDKRFSIAKKISSYQKARIKKILLRLLP
ncbi:MAG: glycosyltransferase family 2 protein [Promethearchaeota archaeon]